MKKIKLIKEETEVAPAPVVTPTTPARPSPLRRIKPNVTPVPKATLEQVIVRFLKLTK